eukprot:759998-Hanusia_phi.AAC.1
MASLVELLGCPGRGYMCRGSLTGRIEGKWSEGEGVWQFESGEDGDKEDDEGNDDILDNVVDDGRDNNNHFLQWLSHNMHGGQKTAWGLQRNG